MAVAPAPPPTCKAVSVVVRAAMAVSGGPRACRAERRVLCLCGEGGGGR